MNGCGAGPLREVLMDLDTQETEERNKTIRFVTAINAKLLGHPYLLLCPTGLCDCRRDLTRWPGMSSIAQLYSAPNEALSEDFKPFLPLPSL